MILITGISLVFIALTGCALHCSTADVLSYTATDHALPKFNNSPRMHQSSPYADPA